MDSLGRSLDKAHLLSHAKRSTLSCQFSGCLRHGGQLRSKFGRDISGRHPPSRFPRARSVRRHRLIHSAWQQQQQPARQPASKASQPASLSGYVMPHENANGERKRVQPGSVNIATGDVNAASSSLVLRVCHRPQRGWRHHGCPTQTCGA